MISLRTRVALVVAAAAVPALGAILYNGLEARRAHVQVGRMQMLRAVRAVVEEQRAQLAEIQDELSLLAHIPEIQSGSREACEALLTDIRRSHPRIGQLTRISAQQRMDCSTIPFADSLADVSGVPVVQRALAARRDVVGFYRLTRDGSRPYVSVLHPVYDDRQRLRFLIGSDVDLPWFATRQRLALDSGYAVGVTAVIGRALIVQSGRVVVRDTALGQLRSQWSPVDSMSGTFLGAGVDGAQRVGAYMRLPSTDGPLFAAAIAAPAAPLLATALGSLREQLTVLVLCAFLGGLFAYILLSRLLMRDVRLVETAANRVNSDEMSLDLAPRPRTRELAGVTAAFERALQRIAEEQRGYLQLANASGDRVGRVDTHLRMIDANDALLALAAAPRRELVGRPIEEVYGAKGVAREIAALAALCLQEGHPLEREVGGPQPDGTDRWTDVRCVPSRADDGTVDGALVITRDATARHVLQREVERSQRVESLGRFAGGIAHDFNNMLTVVLNCAQLGVQELPEGHPSRDDLMQIEQVAKRSADLTRQLLAFAKRQPAAAQPLDAEILLHESEPLLRRLLGAAVELRIEVAPGTSKIWFERSQFDQVLLNLAANARDAMPNRGRLTIALRNEDIQHAARLPITSLLPGPYVRFDVTDTGSGMPPGVASRVFEPFFTTKDARGTGLGLAVVYGAVTQHGGAVWVDSAVGVGTTFHLLFRQPPSVLEPVRVASPVPAVQAHGDARVLVVDDEDAVRTITARLLRGNGVAVEEVSSGAEALARLSADPEAFTVVLSDVIMPDMGGGELAVALLERFPALGIVIASGCPDALASLDPSVNDRCELLQKPFDDNALMAAVRGAAERASAPVR